ncbi:MAG: VOC family protein [Actinomycetota bacterium]
MPLPRLRQVALVAAELAPVSDRLQRDLGLRDPFADPGVSAFGLENAVYAVGDTFLEVVAPVQEETTAGRYLDKRGGDGGYMAIFQVPDIDEARKRVADLGIRVVWQADLDDIAGTHLHPRDVPGAIVSLDWANPPGSWHWAGPAWTGGQPEHDTGGITAITIETPDPERLAQRWADVLGVSAEGPQIELDGGDQRLRFVASDGGEGIVAVEATAPGPARRCEVGSATIEIADIGS